MYDPETERDGEAQGPIGQGSTRAGWFWILLILGGVGFLAYRAYPAHHPLKKNPNFIDSIFANNLVLFAARVILFLAAGVLAVGMVFIVVSVWKRGKAGHWLTRFGPFETQAVEDLRGEVEHWQQLWYEQSEEADQLRERIEHSDRLIEGLSEQLQLAADEIQRRQEEAAEP